MKKYSRIIIVLIFLLQIIALPAYGSSSLESEFVSLLNSARQAEGLSPLPVSGDLVSVARKHSSNMAASNSIYHNPSLGSQVSNWQALGENVGRGPSVSSIHNAFMESSGHRANILDPRWDDVGVGVAVSDGVIYVTQIFRSRYEEDPEPQPTTKSSSVAPPEKREVEAEEKKVEAKKEDSAPAKAAEPSSPVAPPSVSPPPPPRKNPSPFWVEFLTDFDTILRRFTVMAL